jgi:nucleoside-diphosphate-sugar epimerase
MARHVFITGAGGFLGGALLEAMLRNDTAHYYLLLRSPESERHVKARCAPLALRRITFLHGDVRSTNLGLRGEDLESLRKHVDEVWHVAASTRFDDSKVEEVEETNVHGTRNVVQLAHMFRQLDRFFAISTAYICGTSTAWIGETGMPHNMGFKNSYERTKYRSEQLIRQSGLPFAIIRPSIIMGHSQTGEAGNETRMFYGGLLALYRSALQLCPNEGMFWEQWHRTPNGHFLDLNLRVHGHPETTKNLVTIDDVTRVCMGIRAASSVIGKTFHVVNKNNLSVGCVIESMQSALKLCGIRLEPSLSPKDLRDTHHKTELLLHRHCKAWRPYLRYSEPQWETQSVDSLGLPRVDMTPELCQFLMRAYTRKYLAKPCADGGDTVEAASRYSGRGAHANEVALPRAA